MEGGWSDIAQQLKRRREELGQPPPQQQPAGAAGHVSLAVAAEAGAVSPTGSVPTAVSVGGQSALLSDPQQQHRSARPGARRSALGPLLNHLRRVAAEAEAAEGGGGGNGGNGELGAGLSSRGVAGGGGEANPI